MTEVVNPYWDAVKGYVEPKGSLWRTPSVDWLTPEGLNKGFDRQNYVTQFSWSIPDPETLEFVREHAHDRIVDPMCGTGYWAYLLQQLGVDCVTYDLHPVGIGLDLNQYHEDTEAFVFIRQAEAIESVALHPDRTLLLSWPPYQFEAKSILDAYAGDRLIYIGEMEYGCCADDKFFHALEENWQEVASRVPVQWAGIHDVIMVYTRR